MIDFLRKESSIYLIFAWIAFIACCFVGLFGTFSWILWGIALGCGCIGLMAAVFADEYERLYG